jgi:hypothetical protein
MRKVLLYGGLALAGYGAYEYYRTQVALLQNSEYSLAGVSIKEKSPNKVTLGLKLRVVNNSEQEFVIKKYDLMLFLNNRMIGNIRNSALDVKLQGFGNETIIPFDFSFNPKEVGIVDVLFQLLTAKLSNTITVRGDISVKRNWLTLKVPVDFTYSLREMLEE